MQRCDTRESTLNSSSAEKKLSLASMMLMTMSKNRANYEGEENTRDYNQ